MTRLLVSVRSASEAAAALAGGADLIDVKEPLRGPLGAADWQTVQEVVRMVAGRAPVSAALGELRDWQATWPAKAYRGLRYAKLGLAGCAEVPGWRRDWEQATAALPNHVLPVGAVYADWRQAGSPEPLAVIEHAVLEHACGMRCTTLLFDTFDKRGGSLLDGATPGELESWLAAARAGGMRVVLAGGLEANDIPAVLALEPDYIGVRGAVCSPDRAGLLDAERVRSLRNLVHGPCTARASLLG